MRELRTGGLRRSPIPVGGPVGLIAAVPTGIVLQLGTDVVSVIGWYTSSESAGGG